MILEYEKVVLLGSCPLKLAPTFLYVPCAVSIKLIPSKLAKSQYNFIAVSWGEEECM
jgi:hypothetical protein